MAQSSSPLTLASSVAGSTDSLRVGLLNDYVAIPYANGSSFASQLLYRELVQDGHQVTVIGPHDVSAATAGLPNDALLFPSLPLRNHPGVRIPFPSRETLARLEHAKFDLILGQTGSELMEAGVWLRQKRGVPLICVNTIHLPAVYNVVLPDQLLRNGKVRDLFDHEVVPFLNRQSVRVYNASDLLIVLSEGLKTYWRQCGVTVPILVVPRAVEPKLFDVAPGADPYPSHFRRGARLLVVGRHTREKSVDRLLCIFAKLIAPACADVTLTLVGDGPDHEDYRRLAQRLGIMSRCHFAGEVPLTRIASWYRHGDVFVYASLSETFGQVVGEAMWCAMPVVAFADGMGVSGQVRDGLSGFLVPPGPRAAEANWRFSNAVLSLLRNPQLRSRIARAAGEISRRERHPDRVMSRYYDAFEVARRHRLQVRQLRPSSGVDRAMTLLRWSTIHLMLAASGCLRAPASMNLRGRTQPGWNDLLKIPRKGQSSVVPSSESARQIADSLRGLTLESSEVKEAENWQAG